jgi:ribosomal 30S subunit maturation factor RimM
VVPLVGSNIYLSLSLAKQKQKKNFHSDQLVDKYVRSTDEKSKGYVVSTITATNHKKFFFFSNGKIFLIPCGPGLSFSDT